MPSLSNLFSHLPSSAAVGSAIYTGDKEVAKSLSLSALTNFLNDLSDFQKRIKQAQPVAEIKATSQAINLNAQKLYQTEQASLAQGGTEGEAVQFWQNLQKQIDTNPKDEAEIASNLGLKEFKKDGQGRVSGNTLQQLQDVYHAHKGNEKFEKNFRTGLEQIGVMPGSGIYNMITSEESIKAQQAHFKDQTPNEALLKQTGGNLKELIDIKATDDLSNIKSIRGFLDQFKGSIQTLREILEFELSNLGIGVLFKKPPDDKPPPSDNDKKGDDGTASPTASDPEKAESSQNIKPAVQPAPASASGEGVPPSPEGQGQTNAQPAPQPPTTPNPTDQGEPYSVQKSILDAVFANSQKDKNKESANNTTGSIHNDNAPYYYPQDKNKGIADNTKIWGTIVVVGGAIALAHEFSKASFQSSPYSSSPQRNGGLSYIRDENGISLPTFGGNDATLDDGVMRKEKAFYRMPDIYRNANPITQESAIYPDHFGNHFVSYEKVADTRPEDARLMNATLYSGASRPVESETYIGNINIYDAKTDDTFEFAQQVEAVITSALNRTSNIFNPNIAI